MHAQHNVDMMHDVYITIYVGHFGLISLKWYLILAVRNIAIW